MEALPPSKRKAIISWECVELAVEFNPDIFPYIFKAEVLMQLKSSTVEVSMQYLLPKLMEGVKAIH